MKAYAVIYFNFYHGTKIAFLKCVKINGIKVAKWAEVEHRKKLRAERRGTYFGCVRGIFILLVFATIFVYGFDSRLKIQAVTFAQIHHLVMKSPLSTTSDKLRQNALNYEQQVDNISK